jgi:predicted RNA-binding protein YlxR (DUF448 family)
MEPDTDDTTPARDKFARTCVGCGETADRATLVRLVLAPSESTDPAAPASVVVDAAGGAFGRGVHVHPRPACIERASKSGLARSLRTAVAIDPGALSADIASALERRACGLLRAAHRAKKIAVGADATVEALLASPDAVVVVATDAAHAAGLGPVQIAVKEGRAVAWLDRAALGALFHRAEVAVCAVTDERIGAELAHACQARASVGGVGGSLEMDSRGEACRSREVR